MLGSIQNAIIRLAGGVPAPPKTKTRNTRHGEVASGWGASGGIPDLDYLDEMGFPECLDKYRRMANDAQIAKVLRESTQPLINADWYLEPATEDRRDVLIAEFVAANLYQQEGETFGAQFWSGVHWEDRLTDVLRFLQQGFTVFQKVYRKEGKYTVFDKLKYLLPESIERFEPDEKAIDTFRGIIRNYTDTAGRAQPNEFVGMDELIFYTWDQEGSNILGKSLLRSMLMAYEFKQRYAKLQMIDKQKTAVGVPFFMNNADDAPEDVERGGQIAKAMRAGRLEKLWVKIKTGQDFGWKEGGQSTKGIPELIDQQNTEIRNVGGMGFTELGQGGQGGSRGVAGTQAAFSSILLMGIAKKVIRSELPLIREDVDFNFPGVQRYPRLKVRGIDPFEKSRILGEIRESIRDKVITNTIDTENEIRRSYNLMEIGEDERRAAQVSEPSSTDGSGDPGAGEDGDDDSPEDPSGADGTDTGGEGAPEPATQAELAELPRDLELLGCRLLGW